jgi:hypothetical protein
MKNYLQRKKSSKKFFPEFLSSLSWPGVLHCVTEVGQFSICSTILITSKVNQKNILNIYTFVPYKFPKKGYITSWLSLFSVWVYIIKLEREM